MLWGVVLALQSSGAVHLGVDNLSVVRHVWRLLDGRCGSVLFELVKDGDLLVLIERMLHLRCLDTARVTKVKGHADEGMVLDGRVREIDRLGNDAADEAADFGRRRVGNAVVDARRNLSEVCGRWYPVILDLHRFFFLLFLELWSFMMVGMVLLLILWYGLLVLVRRRLLYAFRDRAFLPGPPGIWDSEWVPVPASVICADDIAHWPYTPGLLVKWVAFLGTLHWPARGVDLGVGGISYVELLILYELWAGERLSLEKAQPRYLRPWRPISVSAVPFGPGSGFWRSHGVSLLAAWGTGETCSLLYWCFSLQASSYWVGNCGHGLTSRPRETASELFLNELLGLFRHPPGSGRALLAGTLPLWYCAAQVACRTPTWRVASFWSCC